MQLDLYDIIIYHHAGSSLQYFHHLSFPANWKLQKDSGPVGMRTSLHLVCTFPILSHMAWHGTRDWVDESFFPWLLGPLPPPPIASL